MQLIWKRGWGEERQGLRWERGGESVCRRGSFEKYLEGGGAQVGGLAVGPLFVGNKNQNGGKGLEQKVHRGTGEWQHVLSTNILLTHTYTHTFQIGPRWACVCSLLTHYTSSCNLHAVFGPIAQATHTHTFKHSQTVTNTLTPAQGDHICHSLIYWTIWNDKTQPPSLLIYFDTEEKRIVGKGLYKSKHIDETT